MRIKFVVLSALVACSLAVPTGLINADENHPEPIVLINPFVVSADKLAQTIVMWEQARDFLQKQPGYISTALHQSLTADAHFRLINVAQWESAEDFRAATQRMGKEANLPRIEGVIAAPSLYTVIRRD